MNSPILVDARPLWNDLEEEGRRSGLNLPLWSRWAWVEHDHMSRHRLLALRNDAGKLVACVAVQVDGSRVLPGHRFLRVLRFGDCVPAAAWEPAIVALAELARSDARVLRLSVGVFSREHRGEIAELMALHGFRRQAQPQSYRHTLTVDLRPDENQILEGLHKTARKNLRAVEKSTACLRVLTDAKYAERIAALQLGSNSRTGGKNRALDWAAILSLSSAHPELSRVTGLFALESDSDPEALLAFGWGCMHGDHGEYRSAGTVRDPNVHLPLSYPLLWELMQWAKQQGATWFDLGGVTLGDSATDPLAGISSFKRYFSRAVEEVGEEWMLEPHPARSRLAALLGRGVQGAFRLRDKVFRSADPI